MLIKAVEGHYPFSPAPKNFSRIFEENALGRSLIYLKESYTPAVKHSAIEALSDYASEPGKLSQSQVDLLRARLKSVRNHPEFREDAESGLSRLHEAGME
jgi:hypothetical protein